MPAVRYRLLNVFAETTFGGNPLAVIEDGSALSDADMQLIARQFNLSETTFLLPSERAAARVRIFTPSHEMDFAGHPTLGSAQVVHQLFEAGDRFQLKMKAGLIPVWTEDGRWMLSANMPVCRPFQATPAELAAMLNLPVDAFTETPLWVDCGNEQLIIPLAGVDHVRACRPDPALLSAFSTNAKGQTKTYVFARTDDGFESRYFSMPDKSMINEDPGTGSACANLGGWWLATRGSQSLRARITQGTLIHRPNLLYLEVENNRIHVGGRVIEVGRGQLSW